MPLPQNVTEQLSRVPVRAQGVSAQLLMLTSLIFFISLASYVGLKYGYQPYLDKKIKELDASIATDKQKISPTDQANFINFYSQLTNLKTLLSKHVSGLRFFEWLEKNTQVNVYFQNMTFNFPLGTINLIGQARSINDIGEQVSVLSQLPEVKKVNLTGITSSQNKLWQFNLLVTVDPQLIVGQSISSINP